MSKKLVIVESPAKAKTIGKILGRDYIIRASMGHIRDLPERAFGVDIENNFTPQYEESKSRSRNLAELKTSAKEADEIYLASDPDREGEAIAWHLQEVLQKLNRKAPFHRVSFHEITRSAINRAFQHPGSVNMALVDAQQARRVLDRIVGYQISPLLWTRIERGVSAGRVQSVALRLVCEREREIQAFIPKEYWNFLAKFNPEGTSDFFTGKLAKIDGAKFEIGNSADAAKVIAAVRGASHWNVSNLEITPRRKNAAPPFITSTLQQAASSSLGFSTSQTMRIAQQLYEGVDVGNGPVGLITYMRTDSVAVAVEAQNACRNFIRSAYGASYVPEQPNFYRSKSNAQGAHEAIRPTDVTLTPDQVKSFLDSPQLRLYTLIWRRFVASQMSPAQLERTTATVEDRGTDGKLYSFRSTATVTKFPGFLRAYNIVEEGAPMDEDEEDNRDAAVLGALRTGQNCRIEAPLSEQKFTEPAPRFSEATLVKELETNGIGRPSTYATIVNTIQTRNYVLKEKGKLIPTDLGFRINDYLVASLPELFQVGFTADMEKQLDEVEDGKHQWTGMLADFYKQFSGWLRSAKEEGAPENSKTEALLELISRITSWHQPEKATGKRAFDEHKFFESIRTKYQKDGKISGRQWEALLGLALKYEELLPALQQAAAENGFQEDLAAAVSKRQTMNAAREERQAKREVAERNAPPQTEIAKVFAAMENIKFAPAEKRRGRTYDDKGFYQSLRQQSESGKTLTEKQIAALSKIMEKYARQIPGYDALLPLIGRSAASANDPDSAEKRHQIEDLLERFKKITVWNEPEKKGRRIFDDHSFVESIASQVQHGKTLSEKQVDALNKMAAKYSV